MYLFFACLARYALYLIFWHLFQCFKNFYRVAKGTKKIEKNQARLQKILFRHHRHIVEIPKREDFVTVDDGFISKEELLGPNWTIYSFNKKAAVFVELPHSLTHYSIDKYPFLWLTLFAEAKRVAEIELESFVAWGDELESGANVKAPRCLFFTNTPRSASTVFGSMLHHEGHSIVFGEHPALAILSIGLAQNYWTKEDVSKLIVPTIKFIRKQIPSSQLVIFKGRGTEVFLAPFISQQFPEMKQIFMFRRNGLPSVERMITPSPVYLTLCEMYYRFPTLMSCFTSLVWDTMTEFKPKTNKEAAMIVYAESYLHYQKNKEVFDFPIVWHDELMSTPKEVLEPIFEKLEIPASRIPDALDRMEHDSQDGTLLSQKSMKNIFASELTPEIKEKLIWYAKQFQMELDVLGIQS